MPGTLEGAESSGTDLKGLSKSDYHMHNALAVPGLEEVDDSVVGTHLNYIIDFYMGRFLPPHL